MVSHEFAEHHVSHLLSMCVYIFRFSTLAWFCDNFCRTRNHFKLPSTPSELEMSSVSCLGNTIKRFIVLVDGKFLFEDLSCLFYFVVCVA